MNEESLFHDALARPSRGERRQFLDSACAGRPELRAAVEGLLDAYEQSGEFLDRPLLVAPPWQGDDQRDDTGAPAAVAETIGHDGSTDADKPVALHTLSHVGNRAAATIPARIGRYQVRRLLGRGGMGAVYLAHDPELDRLVALKVPKLGSASAEERFLREARAAAAVTHPNLCPVFDAGRADGVLYLAMAYVQGETLAQLLERQGSLPPERAAAIAAGVARGMAEANAHGIVHRDLKPSNILIDRRGEPIVTDFGLARRESLREPAGDPQATAAFDPRLTLAGAVMGTPAYMSPEQARGAVAAIGPASDVFSLGAILFEMLSGRPPFRAATIEETLRKIHDDPVPALPTVPPALDALCRRALAKDTAQRVPSMQSFAEELSTSALGRRRGPRRIAVAAAAAVLLAIASVVLYLVTDNGIVEVRLSDPKAKVRVTVDGDEITLNDEGRVIKIRAGAHLLEVKGEGFETHAEKFKLKRGDRVVLDVVLTPIPPDPPISDPPPPSDDRKKLIGLLALGERLIEQERLRELEGVADEALKIDPESPTALAHRAYVRAKQGDLVGARADVDAALKLNPECVRALLVLSLLLGEEGKFEECIAVETTIILVAPQNPWGWNNRAVSYFGKDEHHQAIADATKAMELGLPGASALMTRAGARAFLGEYDLALADFDAAIKLAENDPNLHDQRAMLHARMGNLDKAQTDWTRAEELEPIRKGQPRGSLPPPPEKPERKKLTADEETAVGDAVRIARQAWEEFRYDDCEKEVEKAAKIDPTSPDVLILRALVKIFTGRLREGTADANEALRFAPQLAEAYFARAYAQNELNEPTVAIADANIALRLNPEDARSMNTRGWSFFLRKQYRQAKADYAQALQRMPDIIPALQNLGMCHLHLGEYEEALKAFTKAADLQPRDGSLWLVISAVRAKLGDSLGAREAHAKALDIDPKLQSAAEITLPAGLPPPKLDPHLALPNDSR